MQHCHNLQNWKVYCFQLQERIVYFLQAASEALIILVTFLNVIGGQNNILLTT